MKVKTNVKAGLATAVSLPPVILPRPDIYCRLPDPFCRIVF